MWENGARRFNVSAFDLASRSGAWLEARDTVRVEFEACGLKVEGCGLKVRD